MFFSKYLLKNDKIIAIKTSKNGKALGTPKFHKTTKNTQIK
jgi:hypothetical protein